VVGAPDAGVLTLIERGLLWLEFQRVPATAATGSDAGIVSESVQTLPALPSGERDPSLSSVALTRRERSGHPDDRT
jgi:hypothetical protein